MSESGTSAAPAGAKIAKMTKTTFGIAAYAVTSSMMLIVNKLAVTFFPHASVLLCLQLVATTVIIGVLSGVGVLNAAPFEWERARPFLIVALGFLGALYANVKTLQYANVETFIVFRCSVPLLVSVLDRFFLGRAWPNLRSWGSLAVVAAGALWYVVTDANFEVNAYGWVAVWYACFAFDAVYIKKIVDKTDLNVWTLSYYQNALAAPTMFAFTTVNGELTGALAHTWTPSAIGVVFISCVAGLVMSWASMNLRGLVSATTFTVTGTMCKIATVVVNCLMWDKHASTEGLAALFVCLFAGMGYQQAPLRADVKEQRAKEQAMKQVSGGSGGGA
jgi:GDP-mannose transporter